jgi:hypothetical protein
MIESVMSDSSVNLQQLKLKKKPKSNITSSFTDDINKNNFKLNKS